MALARAVVQQIAALSDVTIDGLTADQLDVIALRVADELGPDPAKVDVSRIVDEVRHSERARDDGMVSGESPEQARSEAHETPPPLARPNLLDRATIAELLDFEAITEHGTTKERAIRERFNCSPSVYLARLYRIADDVQAAMIDPALVRRIRERRDRFREVRTGQGTA